MSRDVTVPLDEFLTRYREDAGEWWKLSAGHHQNLFDALLERVEAVEAKLDALDQLHHPRWVTEIRPCPVHLPVTRLNAVTSRDCPDCERHPAVYCSDIRCCGWPCEPHLALHGETAETCAHHAGEPGEPG